MPNYDFECTGKRKGDCPDWIEHVRLEFLDLPLACPRCGEMGKRLVGGKTSFVLKGSGWAKDGYS